MAIFTFYDGINKINVPCASLASWDVISFKRTGKFEHQFSDEVYFKKTDTINGANQFVYDKWYKATEIVFHEDYIEVNNWIEKAPFRGEQATLKNSIQIIGDNITVTGNNFNLGDVKLEVFLKGLEAAITANNDIPDSDKKNILVKLKDIINNPYLSGIFVNSLYTYIQPFLPKI